MIAWIKRRFARRVDARDSSAFASLLEPANSGAAEKHPFSSDQPIETEQQDRFNRAPFAKRLATTLAERKDPSSLVVGLYGPWGDGKTSTLRLMEATLAAFPHVVCVAFNPWHFESATELLKGFFATLAEALERSLPTMSERIGKAFKDYGALLSLASFSLGGVIQIKPGDMAKGLGEALSTVRLEELRKRIDHILAESGKRIVVLIDDIDRLDRNETHAVLKLVKLSAGFRYTSYVLSFDDAMVAAAIGEQYAGGGVDAGRSFLEKIVQVPLHLPPPDGPALRQMAFDGANAALELSQTRLTQPQVDRFVRHFVDGLEPGLKTPRHAKLYGNALLFALPLLKGEVNTVELMLLEGARVFYPKLYAAVRDNGQVFIGASADGAARDRNRTRASELITEALSGATAREIDQIRTGLLEPLFPRLSNMGYGPEWNREWAREQRLCSEQYFRRYFTYSVPPGDVADLQVRALIDRFPALTAPEQDVAIREFAERQAMPQFVRKLREHETDIDPNGARVLAVAFARNGHVIPRERGAFLFAGTLTQAGILISQLLRRVAPGDRTTIARDVIAAASPLPVGFECLRWMRHGEHEPEANRLLPQDAEEQVGAALVDRIREAAGEEPLYVRFANEAQGLYWLWAKHDRTEVAQHLQASFARAPEQIDLFLDTYVGEAWGLETGLPHRADFRRDSYDAIAQLIDPEATAAVLTRCYGDSIGEGDYHTADRAALHERTAHQFMFIHRTVERERTQSAPPAQ